MLEYFYNADVYMKGNYFRVLMKLSGIAESSKTGWNSMSYFVECELKKDLEKQIKARGLNIEDVEIVFNSIKKV